jgi:hypothetical protein
MDDEAKRALEREKQALKKRKKSRLSVPEEFLDGAKSYDDKLILVKMLTEKEKHRVVLMFKKMIQSGMAEANKKKGIR